MATLDYRRSGQLFARKENSMDQVLTTDEISARYAPNWVLIGDPQTDENHHVLAGRFCS